MGKVLSAQGTGYYPSCIQVGERPNDESYLDLSIEEGMALYWRTKKWRVDASGSFTSDDYDYPITYSGSSLATRTPKVEAEENLVCTGKSEFVVLGDILWNGGLSKAEFAYDFTFGYKSDSKFYPYFVCNAPLIGTFPSGDKVGNIFISFNGYTKTGSLYYSQDAPGTPSGNVLLSFTCIEYWSYGGTYDTTTGQSL